MMKTLALPTICMAVAPIRCTMEMPHKFSDPAQNMFSTSTGTSQGLAPPATGSAPTAAPHVAAAPSRRARRGTARPTGSREARTMSTVAAAGAWKSRSCSGVSTGSSSSTPLSAAFAARTPLRPRTLRWMATFLRERKHIAPRDIAMPRNGRSAPSTEAASTPPRIARMPPQTTRATATQACAARRSPNAAERTMVMAGVMLPSTALRPGSMRPREMLLPTVAMVCASTTGRTRRAKRPTKRRLRNGTPGDVGDAPGRVCAARHMYNTAGTHNVANCTNVRKAG
mmetsp:Transcript_88750/g.248329  ORF Transcript_88750/g.248329 Transcript_88750/m.248329 type:complete len:284 (-) Transcript_88750:329-1180(-)